MFRPGDAAFQYDTPAQLFGVFRGNYWIKEKRRKRFPISLVDFSTVRDWECFDADCGKDLWVEIREYFIPDFSNWKDHDAFESGFARLLRDLRAGESTGAEPG